MSVTEMDRIEARRQEALNLLERATALSTRAAKLPDSAMSLLLPFRGGPDIAVKADIDQLRVDLIAFDRRMLGDENVYTTIDASRTAAMLTIRSAVRATIGQYVDEAARSLNDSSMRALTRATLNISVLVWMAAVLALWVH